MQEILCITVICEPMRHWMWRRTDLITHNQNEFFDNQLLFLNPLTKNFLLPLLNSKSPHYHPAIGFRTERAHFAGQRQI